MNKIIPGWRFEANYSDEADNGRIVVVWDPLLSVVVYFKSPQIMVCGIFNLVTSQSFTAAFVYARNLKEERIRLWSDILQLSYSALVRNSPWITLGDFNQVAAVSEVYSLSEPIISPGGMEEFNSCMASSEIFDMSFRGCQFTWTNKSITNLKARKLDRALINEAWLEHYPDSYAYFDAPGTSDHSPCLIYLSNDLSMRKTRFVFFSMFTTHLDYASQIKDVWLADIQASSSMFDLYHRLKTAKSDC